MKKRLLNFIDRELQLLRRSGDPDPVYGARVERHFEQRRKNLDALRKLFYAARREVYGR